MAEIVYAVTIEGGPPPESCVGCLPSFFGGSRSPPRDVQARAVAADDADTRAQATIYTSARLRASGATVRLVGDDAQKLTRAELAAVLNRIGVAQLRHGGDEQVAGDLFSLAVKMRTGIAPCAQNNLALLYERQGRLSDASAALRSAVKTQTALGGDPEKLCLLHMNLAHVCEQEGSLAEAERLLRLALVFRIDQCGPEHREVAKVLNLLGALETKQGRIIKAQETLTQALNILERIGVPAEDPELARAAEHLTAVYDVESPHFGLDKDHHHAEMAKTLLSLARTYAKKEGGHHAERGLQLLKGTFGEQHPHVHKFRRDMLLERDDDGGDDQDESELEDDPLSKAGAVAGLLAPPGPEEAAQQLGEERAAEQQQQGDDDA